MTVHEFTDMVPDRGVLPASFRKLLNHIHHSNRLRMSEQPKMFDSFFLCAVERPVAAIRQPDIRWFDRCDQIEPATVMSCHRYDDGASLQTLAAQLPENSTQHCVRIIGP